MDERLKTCVAGNVRLDITHPDNEATLAILEEIQGGITYNPKGNLILITNPIPDRLEKKIERFIEEARGSGQNAVTTGGTVSNTGLPLSFLIGPKNVTLMGRRGGDKIGETIEGIVRENHSGETFLRIGQEQSSYTLIARLNNYPHYFHFPGSNEEFEPEDINWEIVRSKKNFIFGCLPMMPRWHLDNTTIANIFCKIKGTGSIRTYLDMSGMSGETYKWQKILEWAMADIDVFNPNIKEALFVMNPKYLGTLLRKEEAQKRAGNTNFDVIDAMKKPRRVIKQLGNYYLGLGARAVLIKCGKHGLYLKTGIDNPPEWSAIEIFTPAYVPKHVADTTGAGDNVLAALIAGYANGLSPALCLELGVGAGLKNVEYEGSVGAFRTMEELLKIDRERINTPALHESLYDKGLSFVLG